MEGESKIISMIMAGLKFSKTEIGKIAKDEKYTNTAITLISIVVLFGAVIALFKGNSGSSGVVRMGLTGITAAIAELGSLVIGTFLSAFVMVYVLRIFKAEATFNGVLRVYGAAIIWTLLKLVFGLILPPGLAMVAVLFWLAYNFAVLFGLTGYTGIKLWKSFVSIVITFAIIFIIMLPYGSIIKLLFG